MRDARPTSPGAAIHAVSVRGRPEDAALGREIAEAVAAALGERSWSGDRSLKALRIRITEGAAPDAIRAALSRSLGGGDG